jgi:hypothetical protein
MLEISIGSSESKKYLNYIRREGKATLFTDDREII